MGYFYCPQHAEETHHPFRALTVCAASLAVLVIPMIGAADDWWQHTAPSQGAQTSAVSVIATASPRATDPPSASSDSPAIAAPAAATLTLPAPPPGPAVPAADAPPQAVATDIDIPARVLLAYMNAADAANVTHPGCHLQWQFLAALGEVESHDGQIHGSTVGADGVVSPAIYGPALDGSAAGVVGSVVDVSGRSARAMGPMQFIPSTWAAFGGGGNPQDIDDAALAAADYVCHDGRDLGSDAGRYAGAFSYNHADWYVVNVLAIYADYVAGKPGTSRPETPPPGTDPAANATTGQPASSVTTPIPTAPTTDPSAGTPFTTSKAPPAPATPPGQTYSPSPTSEPSTTPTPSGTLAAPSSAASPSSPSDKSAADPSGSAPGSPSAEPTSPAVSTSPPAA